jgi:hypothetical protein
MSKVTNYSSFVAPGAKAVTVPLVGLRTADSKTTEQVLEWNGLASAESAGTITLSSHAADPILIEDIAQLQTNFDLFTTFARAGAYAVRAAVETTLADLIQSATTNTVSLANAADNTITYAHLLAAGRMLNIQNVRMNECTLAMSPEAFEKSVAEWNTNGGGLYTSAAVMGSETFAATGAEGKILGMPVYVSNDWDGTGGTGEETASIWHPNAVGFASNGGLRTKGPVPVPLHIADGFVLHMIYGSAKLIDAGIVNFNNTDA